MTKMKNDPRFIEWEKFHENMFRHLEHQEKFEGWI